MNRWREKVSTLLKVKSMCTGQPSSKIHVYRATKRMTQQELADLVGVSRQTIMQLERNRYNPSMLLAYSIARVFDVTIEDLFDFKGA